MAGSFADSSIVHNSSAGDIPISLFGHSESLDMLVR